MSKPAVAAALSIALSFGAASQTRAQDSNGSGDGAAQPLKISQSQQQDLPTGFKAPQSTTNKVSYPGSMPETWQTNPTTGIGTFQPKGNAKPPAATTTTTTTTTTSSSSPAIPPPRAQQPRAIPGFPGYPRVMPATTPAAAAPRAATAQPTKKDETMVVQQGPLDTAAKAGWNRFENYITLSGGQDQLSPLTLQVNNGVGGPPFTMVRLMLSGRQIASEKNFSNNAMTMSMVGALGNGTNQLVVSAFGQAGSKLQWKVITLKPSISGATPKEVAAADTITITGKNFSPSTAVDQVYFGNKQGAVTKASQTSIEATVPDGLQSGDLKLTVRVGGVDTKPYTISIKLVPELTSVDMFSSPPGQPIVLTGKNFAAAASDNQVTIGGQTAQITSASSTTINCVIPELDNPIYGVPISVKSKNVKSKNELKIDVQRRVIPNDGSVPRY